MKVDETIVLSELAKRMGIKANEMIVKLMGMGVMATVNQTIDYDTAVLVAGEFDYEVERASFEEDLILKKIEAEDPEKLASRPPVVTIMGHVTGNVTARDRIELKSTTRLNGDIRAKRLTVEDGVTFIGKSEVNPSGAAGGRPQPEASAAASDQGKEEGTGDEKSKGAFFGKKQ